MDPLDQIFQTHRSVEVKISPFFAPRVSARVKSQLKQVNWKKGETSSVKNSLWDHLVGAWGGSLKWAIAGALAAGGYIGVQNSYKATPSGIVGVPMAIEVTHPEVDIIEVTLPQGIQFVSQDYPHLVSGKREIQLTLKSGMDHRFPIMVQSERSGVYEIQLKLYAKDSRHIEDRSVVIEFK